MIQVPYLLLDVFTDRQFSGNPLAVVVDPPALDDSQMASIAREFNLSETIFLDRAGERRWNARIFTPVGELPFAGHPTVGGAVALALSEQVPIDTGGAATSITLAEVAGDVAVEVRRTAGLVGSATFTAPRPPRLQRSVDDTELADVFAAVGLTTDRAHPALGSGVWSAGVPFTVIPVASLDALGSCRVDGSRLATLTSAGIPTAFYVLTGDGDRWSARMFAPDHGIAEDPATGSAACAAAGLLATTVPDGEARWTLTQGVEMGRPSRLDLSSTVTDGVATETRLGGDAVFVGGGTLRLDDGGSVAVR